MPAINHLLHPGAVINAAIYARVSKEEPKDQPGFSLPGQIQDCLRYAATYGLHVDPAHIFQDDFTGKVPNRPAVDSLYDILASGQIQALIVARVDRLGRTDYDTVVLFRELERHGIALCLVGLPPGQEGREHKMLLRMLSMFAEFEHSILLERMEKGRRNRALAGYPRKQKVTYGYQWKEELLPDGSQYEQAKAKRQARGHYVIHPKEAAIIHKIFHWYVVEGWTAYRIAQQLNAMGIPTIRDQRGYARRQHAINGWCRSSVQNILSNADYLGTQIYGKRTVVARKPNNKPAKMGLTPEETWIPVTIPALIEPALFQAAQERAAWNKRFYAKRRKHTHLFGAGRVTCGVCQLHMGGALNHGRVYYRCNAQQAAPGVCRRQLSGRRLEAAIWCEIRARFSDPKKARTLFYQEVPAGHAPSATACQAEHERLEKEQRQVSSKLERLERAYYAGGESPEEYADKKKRFKKDRELVATQLLALKAQEKQGQLLQEHQHEMWQVLEVIAEELDRMETLEEKLHVLRLLRLTVVYLSNRQLEIRVQPFAPLGKNVAMVTTLPVQVGHHGYFLTWTTAA